MRLPSPVTESTTHVTRDSPYDTAKTNIQSRFSTNVWYCIIDMFIGAVILDYRMIGHNYLDSLQSGLPEQLKCFFGYTDCCVHST
jgi:hypothetical protein